MLSDLSQPICKLLFLYNTCGQIVKACSYSNCLLEPSKLQLTYREFINVNFAIGVSVLLCEHFPKLSGWPVAVTNVLCNKEKEFANIEWLKKM